MMFRNNYSSTRRSRRHWWNGAVDLFTQCTRVKALSVNISQGGMCLFAVANLHLGSSVEVEFESPNSNGIKRVAGRIRHRALYLYGIEFLREKEFSPEIAVSSANAEITAKRS
jgi:hypothetical protein